MAIVEGNVPLNLQGKRVISLQLGLLVADTKYRGEFEERLKVTGRRRGKKEGRPWEGRKTCSRRKEDRRFAS